MAPVRPSPALSRRGDDRLHPQHPLGSITYNATHSHLLGIVLVTTGFATGTDLITQLGLIAVSHVGMDRMLGYGLKYATGFKHTHMQRV